PGATIFPRMMTADAEGEAALVLVGAGACFPFSPRRERPLPPHPTTGPEAVVRCPWTQASISRRVVDDDEYFRKTMPGLSFWLPLVRRERGAGFNRSKPEARPRTRNQEETRRCGSW